MDGGVFFNTVHSDIVVSVIEAFDKPEDLWRVLFSCTCRRMRALIKQRWPFVPGPYRIRDYVRNMIHSYGFIEAAKCGNIELLNWVEARGNRPLLNTMQHIGSRTAHYRQVIQWVRARHNNEWYPQVAAGAIMANRIDALEWLSDNGAPFTNPRTLIDGAIRWNFPAGLYFLMEKFPMAVAGDVNLVSHIAGQFRGAVAIGLIRFAVSRKAPLLAGVCKEAASNGDHELILYVLDSIGEVSGCTTDAPRVNRRAVARHIPGVCATAIRVRQPLWFVAWLHNALQFPIDKADAYAAIHHNTLEQFQWLFNRVSEPLGVPTGGGDATNRITFERIFLDQMQGPVDPLNECAVDWNVAVSLAMARFREKLSVNIGECKEKRFMVWIMQIAMRRNPTTIDSTARLFRKHKCEEWYNTYRHLWQPAM